MRDVGASCNNPRHTYSYVNYFEKFVVFTEWSHDFDSGKDSIIFSENWRTYGEDGPKNGAFEFSKSSIELVLHGGFNLLTVKKTAIDASASPLRVKRFERVLDPRRLVRKGPDYFAVVREEGYISRNKAGVQPPVIDEANDLWEGERFTVLQVGYERNLKARSLCLEVYRHICRICDFDFAKVYGDIGEDFIHVHHLVPVSKRDGAYKVDFRRDLRPVCPNCHAMIHRRAEAYTINEVRTRIGRDALEPPE